MRQINPKWIDRMRKLIEAKEVIDETCSYRPATQWLIEQLLKCNRAYKLINCGAGVTRITTDTDTCPLCKRPFAAHSNIQVHL